MSTTPTSDTLSFYVETRRAKGWRRYYEPLSSLYNAREAAGHLSTLPGVEARVTDEHGEVWA